MTQQYKSPSVPVTPLRLRNAYVILGSVLGSILLWSMSEPLPQNPAYHDFADQRSVFGVPHALNVLSNVAFCLVGLLGCSLINRSSSKKSYIDIVYLSFFTGVFLTGIGSAYYHLSPDDSSLVWDRLPMTMGFMSFTAIVIAERYNEKYGLKLFPWLLVAGFLSVGYWVWQGDLRPYLYVQFGPMLILPLIIWRFKGPGTRWLWAIIFLYFIAKVLELYDQQFFQITGSLISGHSLKHLVAAVGVLMIVVKVRTHLVGELHKRNPVCLITNR